MQKDQSILSSSLVKISPKYGLLMDMVDVQQGMFLAVWAGHAFVLVPLKKYTNEYTFIHMLQ